MLQALFLQKRHFAIHIVIVKKSGPKGDQRIKNAAARYILAIFFVSAFRVRQQLAIRTQSAWITPMRMVRETGALKNLGKPVFDIVPTEMILFNETHLRGMLKFSDCYN